MLKSKRGIWQIELIKSIEETEHVRIKLTDALSPHYSLLFDEIRLPRLNIERASKLDLLSTTYHEVGHAKAKRRKAIDFFAIVVVSLISVWLAFLALLVLASAVSTFGGMLIVVYSLMLGFFLPLLVATVLLPTSKGVFMGSIICTLYLLTPIVAAPFSSPVMILLGMAFSALFVALVRLEKSVPEWRADIFAARKVGVRQHFKARPWWTKVSRRKITAWKHFWFKILMPYYVCPLEKRISTISKHTKSNDAAFPWDVAGIRRNLHQF